MHLCVCVCVYIIIYYIHNIAAVVTFIFVFAICLNKIVYNSKSSHLLCVSHQIIQSAIGIGQQIFNICGFLVVIIIIICILYIYTFLMNCLKSVNVCDQL